MIAQLIALEQQLWRLVTSNQEPAADGSDSADLALRCLYPKDASPIVAWKADPSMGVTFGDLLDVRSQLSQYQEQESQLKQTIQQAMGSASVALFETGVVSWKPAKEWSRIDTKKLAHDQPELIAQYMQPKAGFKRFLLQTKE
ncbi:hypothetical protein [Lampropedia aestuarii]|uniref:hypothetical protein n=1 Tax=Lampropedia aestuarii TaxID=2562762 RepID=UPI002468A716|nr:hypothetical protein [Lampropedia aestuarii]MDH5859266.1 hypothetical protein [Lampropedia aestuarii]